MKLAISTPDAREAEYAEYAAAFYERYRAVFARLDVETIASPWTAPLPDGIDALAPMLAWGYHLDVAKWLNSLKAWDARTILVNSAAALRWNTHKTYLTELAKAGVPVIPTVMAARADAATLARAAEELGADELVVKPQVSAAAHRTVRIKRGETPAEILPDAMIQPFLPEVGGDGELSVFYFGGRFSHAVRKVAAEGEFRVQPHYGGTLTVLTPPADVLATAELALAAAPVPVTYARIDLVRGAHGRPLLMEFEAIEPDLYFDLCPDGGLAYAQAVIAAIQSARS